MISERIKQLREKIQLNQDLLQEHLQEQFAKLIILECIFILESRYETFKGSGDEYARGFKSGLDAATKTVKAHYGVE